MTAAAMSVSPAPLSPSQTRPADSKASEQKANEPSMEEILASIRRIIADDAGQPKARKWPPVEVPRPEAVAAVEAAEAPAALKEPEPEPAAPLAQPEAAILPDARQMHPAAEVAAAELQPVEPEATGPVLPEPAGAAAIEPEPEAEEGGEIFDLAEQAETMDAFAFLSPSEPPLPSHPVFAPAAEANAPLATSLPVADPLVSPGTDAAVSASFQSLAQTVMLNNSAMIEQMTREMLRPMLKTWLDDNLPVMVERLVRTEIERVARGGR